MERKRQEQVRTELQGYKCNKEYKFRVKFTLS